MNVRCAYILSINQSINQISEAPKSSAKPDSVAQQPNRSYRGTLFAPHHYKSCCGANTSQQDFWRRTSWEWHQTVSRRFDCSLNTNSSLNGNLMWVSISVRTQSCVGSWVGRTGHQLKRRDDGSGTYCTSSLSLHLVLVLAPCTSSFGLPQYGSLITYFTCINIQ